MNRTGRLPLYSLVATSLVSGFGNQLTMLAVPWFVLETTGSAARTGMIAAITLIPMVISMAFTGAMVDRMPRRQLAIGADLLSAITVAAVPFFYLTTGLNFWALAGLMFLGAIFDNPGSTARQSMIPALSRQADISLERTQSAFGVTASVTQLLGPPLAGVLIAVIGEVNVLWFNAFAFVFAVAAVLLCIPALPAAEPSGDSFMGDMRAGIQFMKSHRALLAIAMMSTVANFVFSPMAGVALPYLANTIYESSWQLGFLMGCVGFGGLLGALAYGALATRWSRRSNLIVSLAIISVPIWFLAVTPVFLIACVLVFTCGIGAGLVNPMIATWLMRDTPEHMLGRAMSFMGFFSMVAAPVGMLLGGLVIEATGFGSLMLLFGALLSALFVFSILFDGFRNGNMQSGKPSLASAD